MRHNSQQNCWLDLVGFHQLSHSLKKIRHGRCKPTPSQSYPRSCLSATRQRHGKLKLNSVGRTAGPQLSVRSWDWPKLNLVLDASSSILTQSQCVKEAKRNFILELFGLLLSLFAWLEHTHVFNQQDLHFFVQVIKVERNESRLSWPRQAKFLSNRFSIFVY